MVLALSQPDSQALADYVTGRAASRGSTTRTLYAALCSSAPSGTTVAALLANEIATAGYARQAVTWSAPSSSAGTTDTHNTGALTWGPFTADPPSEGWIVLTDASSGTGGATAIVMSETSSVDAGNGDSIQSAASGVAITVPYQT